MNELDFRRLSGLCERCGIAPADYDHVCEGCRDKQKAHPGVLPTRLMGEAAFRRAAGLCWLCGAALIANQETNLCEGCDQMSMTARNSFRKRCRGQAA